MKLIRLCLALTATLAAACSAGEDGGAGKPGEAPPAGAAAGDLPEAPVLTINQITPRVGLVDRAIEVAVSFDGAARFDLDKAELDFGPGIEIVETHVAAGAIVAQLVIGPDAKLGAHDVTATVPGVGPAVASKGFHVAVALEATVAAGKAEQGGLLPSQNPFTGEFDPAPHDLHVAVPVVGGASAVDHYVVLADISGTSGAKSTITASRSTALATFESPSAHGPDAPQALEAVSATYARLVTGEMKSVAEVDVYKLTVGAADKIQLTAVSDADLEIILTKDPKVLEDDEDAPPAQRKVLGYFYPGKMSAQRVVTPGATTLYAVIRSDSQSAVKTGKYTFGARKLP